MTLFLKFDTHLLCNKVLNERLDEINIKYNVLAFGEIEILEPLTKSRHEAIKNALEPYGIIIIEDHKKIMIQKIKDAIIDLVNDDDETIMVKSSVYLAERLNQNYGYLSNLFSEMTFSSIENYIILQKIERTKQLMATTTMTLTDIAFKLNYSSVAHLSSQFKNTTGITPSAFQRIISKRRDLQQD
ncbi:helix-turn-helix domain-containing protein [Psychroserpens sp.]|uniref:helix-turn-helix domain-containing protein n=1 Tax=Psychroserpens sp. TaxID=2020870 RepID=UPI003C712EFC